MAVTLNPRSLAKNPKKKKSIKKGFGQLLRVSSLLMQQLLLTLHSDATLALKDKDTSQKEQM